MPMPSTTNTSSDSDTAPITREPAFATVPPWPWRPLVAAVAVLPPWLASRIGYQ